MFSLLNYILRTHQSKVSLSNFNNIVFITELPLKNENISTSDDVLRAFWENNGKYCILNYLTQYLERELHLLRQFLKIINHDELGLDPPPHPCSSTSFTSTSEIK